MTTLLQLNAAAALVIGATFASASASVHAAPLLRCEVTYAGSTQTVDTRVVGDPYPVASVDIAGRFRFKAVMVGQGDFIDYIKLYTYLETPRQPVLVQQATYRPPFPISDKRDGLTGEQRVFAGTKERELIYRCALLGMAP